jgi:hypothetical protein
MSAQDVCPRWPGLVKHICYKPVTLGRDCDYESLGIRVVAQRPPNFPYCGINADVAILGTPLAPDPLNDLVPRHQLSVPFGEQEEQIERDALQVHDPAAAAEFMGAPVKFEICETQHTRRQLHRLHGARQA